MLQSWCLMLQGTLVVLDWDFGTCLLVSGHNFPCTSYCFKPQTRQRKASLALELHRIVRHHKLARGLWGLAVT